MDSIQLVSALAATLWRRKLAVLGAAGLTVLLVLLAIALCPRTYRSEAKLFVRLGRETVTLDPTATTGKTVPVQSSREIEIRSVSDMLASRVLIEQVVDQLGPEYVLRPPPPRDDAAATRAPESSADGGTGDRPGLLSLGVRYLRAIAQRLGLSDPISRRDQAVIALGKKLRIEGGTKSSVLTVALESKTPQAARRLLRAHLDAYRRLHVRVNRTPENYQFFAEQTEMLAAQLQSAREQLREAKDAQGIVEIEIRKKNLQEQLSQVDLDIRNGRARLAAAEATLAAATKQLEQIPQRMLTDELTGLGDPATDIMRPELYKLEIAAARAKEIYAAGHPRREQALQQLAESREIFERQSRERPQQTATINQAWQEVQLKAIEAEATRAALLSELDALHKEREGLRETLRALNAAEIRIAQLQEKVDLLQESHRQYAENLELSRIDEELQREEISNVSIVQPPTLNPRPVKPNKKLIFAFGCMLALLNGVAAAVLRDWRRLWALTHQTMAGWGPLPAPPSMARAPRPGPSVAAAPPVPGADPQPVACEATPDEDSAEPSEPAVESTPSAQPVVAAGPRQGFWGGSLTPGAETPSLPPRG
jgi:uncharacterized protein involved in exopolysaccharide biosynthesis